MSATAMWVIAAIVIALPVILMVAFNRRDFADSRGRRISRRWKVRR